MHKKIQRITKLALFTAVALLLGYVESLIPFYPGIAGIKLGLPNLVTVWMLYTTSLKDTFMVSITRIILNALLFGNGYSFLFSFSGGMMSLLLMYVVKQFHFHMNSVSIVGGISHNIGQILIAMILTSTINLFYYFPILLISGMICGLMNGMIANALIHHIPGYNQ